MIAQHADDYFHVHISKTTVFYDRWRDQLFRKGRHDNDTGERLNSSETERVFQFYYQLKVCTESISHLPDAHVFGISMIPSIFIMKLAVDLKKPPRRIPLLYS